MDLARAGRWSTVALATRSGPSEPSGPMTEVDRIRLDATGAPVAGDPLLDRLASSSGGVGLVFCVPDDALRDVAARWAARTVGGAGPRVVHALHTSGLHPAAALAPLRAAASGIAGCHPLVAIAAPSAGRFRGITFGVEGDPASVAFAGEIAAAAGGTTMAIRPGQKAVYHLAAVFGSNFLVACLAVAVRLLGRSREAEAGDVHPFEDPDDLLEALIPLATSAVGNVAQAGLARGLTGPIARGDVGTVRRHLEALDPAARDLYRALAAELLRARDDDLPADVRARLWRAVSGPGAAPSGGGTSIGR